MRFSYTHIVYAGLLTAATATTGLAAPPVFFDTSPETTMVDLNAGQTSFLIMGSARDAQANHAVDFFAFGLQPFMTMETTPGNPGSFRIFANNLTGANYGGYFVDVVAFDDEQSVPSASGYSFAVGIVPEPELLLVILAPLMALRRRGGLS